MENGSPNTSESDVQKQDKGPKEDTKVEVAMNVQKDKPRYFINREEVSKEGMKTFRDRHLIRLECPFLFLNETSIQNLCDHPPQDLFTSVRQAICAGRFPGEFPRYWPYVIERVVQEVNRDIIEGLSLFEGHGGFKFIWESSENEHRCGIQLYASRRGMPSQNLRDLPYNDKCHLLKLLIHSFQQFDILPFWCIDDRSDETSPRFDMIMKMFRSSKTQTFVATLTQPRFSDPSGVKYINTENTVSNG